MKHTGIKGPGSAAHPRGPGNEVRDREGPRAGPERRMNAPARGDLFIVSSPSGGGQSTLIRRRRAPPRGGGTSPLLRRPLPARPAEPLHFSISHTTRAMRTAEENGRESHFVTT